MFNINRFAGEINKGGVAYQSHFLVVFTTPERNIFRGGGARVGINDLDRAFNEALLRQNIASTSTGDGYRNIALRCDRVNIPGRIIISSPYKEGNYGLVREYPTNAVYQPVDCSFVLSKDFSEKIFFETWQDLIIGNHRTSQFGDENADGENTKDLNYIKNYSTRISIIQFDNVPARSRDERTSTSGIFETISRTVGQFSPFGGSGSRTFEPAEPTPVYMCTLNEAYPRTIQDMQGDWGSSDIHRLNVVFDYKYFQDKQLKPVIADEPIRTGDPTITSGFQQGAAVLAGQIARRAGLSQRQTAFLTGATTVARQVFGKVAGKFSIR